jgi:hypothetical protein
MRKKKDVLSQQGHIKARCSNSETSRQRTEAETERQSEYKRQNPNSRVRGDLPYFTMLPTGQLHIYNHSHPPNVAQYPPAYDMKVVMVPVFLTWIVRRSQIRSHGRDAPRPRMGSCNVIIRYKDATPTNPSPRSLGQLVRCQYVFEFLRNDAITATSCIAISRRLLRCCHAGFLHMRR